MFLIYEYMERGSLFCVLCNDVEAKELNWRKRMNIIKGIANALCYMHHDCKPPIVHRDVTCNNVLLNSNLDAFVSDFGTATLLDPDSSNQTLLVGTRGYIAPVVLLYSKHVEGSLGLSPSSSYASKRCKRDSFSGNNSIGMIEFQSKVETINARSGSRAL
ncbi:hypothetical protein Ahy_A02g006332 isoform B [Arachis hypogaea]|uniref:non-specific serine/threonine protein kinase n=1 Tax=Arachis hypogaea TaxID=3818 RepID=A0A445E9W9_ARAHY|nr:hypothetical protein Ahy_A02g006332 isoform B [Arachis hypogaea]